MELRQGLQIGGYELASFIGRGGMAQVWSVRDRDGRMFAVKTLLPEYAADAALQERLLREATSQTQLQHPSILRAYGTFQSERRTFILMELVDGESLEACLERRRALPVPEVYGIALAVLSGLAHAHSRKIVHRDVKPSNILLARNGSILLGDFGIALLLGQQRLTRFGVMGTPAYMSPEQIRTPLSIDHRSDIYSFGCVLYEMLTGYPPFHFESGENDFLVREAHLQKVPQPLAGQNLQVTKSLDDAVLRALEKDPGARFQSCEEFASGLGLRIDKRTPVPAPKPRVVIAPGIRVSPNPSPPAGGAPVRATPGSAPAARGSTPAGGLEPAAPVSRGISARTPASRTPGPRTPLTPAAAARPAGTRMAIAALAAACLLAIFAIVWLERRGAGHPAQPSGAAQSEQIPAGTGPASAAAGQAPAAGQSAPLPPVGAPGERPAPAPSTGQTAGEKEKAGGEPAALAALRRLYDQMPSASTDKREAPVTASHPTPLAPPPAAYRARQSGVLRWDGQRSGDLVVIDSAQVGNGVLSGDALPGVPVSITVDDPEVAVAQYPSPSDGYRRLSLRISGNVNKPINIKWQVKKGGDQ